MTNDFRLAVNHGENNRYTKIKRFHTGKAKWLSDRCTEIDICAIKKGAHIMLKTAEGNKLTNIQMLSKRHEGVMIGPFSRNFQLNVVSTLA